MNYANWATDARMFPVCYLNAGCRNWFSAMTAHVRFAGVVCGIWLGLQVVSAQDMLQRARELYESAGYEEALSSLDAVHASTQQSEMVRQAGRELRALCLIALNRTSEADVAIDAILQTNPFYTPSGDEAPPRLIAAVSRARQQLLPALVDQAISVGSKALEAKRYDEADTAFKRAVQLATDSRLDSTLRASLLKPLQRARDLLERASLARLGDMPLRVTGPPVYTAADRDVTPPVALRQQLPDLPDSPSPPAGLLEGRVELLIGPTGRVQSVKLTDRIHPSYDPLLLKAAQEWTYRPARKDGVPVTYQHVMAVLLSLDVAERTTAPVAERTTRRSR